MFALVVSICLCGLVVQVTTSVPSVHFDIRNTIVGPPQLLHLSDSAIKLTFRNLPNPKHYGTFAANNPENVVLVPCTVIRFSPAKGHRGWVVS